MKNIIEVEGLDITLTNVITGIRLSNGRAVERTETGIQWNGNVTLLDVNKKSIANGSIHRAIMDNSFITFEELNVKSQIEHSKDYSDLTVAESQEVQGVVMANNMIAAINESNCGLIVDDVTTLVLKIIEAIG